MAFDNRTINVVFLEPAFTEPYEIEFHGTILGDSGKVLLEKTWTFTVQADGTIDDTGDTLINLPAPATGFARYDCVFPKGDRTFTRPHFFLEAGAQIDLSELLELYTTAPTTIQSIIDTLVEDQIVDGVTDKTSTQNAIFDALALKQNTITPATTADYFRGDKTFQPLNAAAVGLGNVPNLDATSRSNHTGTQLASTISDFESTVNGLGVITALQSGVSDNANEIAVNAGDIVTNTAAIALKANINSPTFTGTVAGITKAMVGLGNVDNTSDSTKNSAAATLTNKTISGANNTLSNIPQAAVSSLVSDLAGKQATLVSGTNIKTINSTSLLGSGNIAISASPAGSNTQLQYNNSGAFGASANLTFANDKLVVDGSYLHSDTTSVFLNSGHKPSGLTSTFNVVIGKNAMGAGNATTAFSSVLVGQNTGRDLITGYQNVLIGDEVGKLVTTGALNTFIGFNSGAATVNGSALTYVGSNAGRVATGSNNAFFGANAGYENTTGSSNTFIGYQSAYNNTTGILNTFIGYNAGWTGTGGTGFGNVFIGAMNGAMVLTSGYNNTCLGLNAGLILLTGNRNTLLGAEAGQVIDSGSLNSIIGNQAGFNLTSGNSNVLIGSFVGDNLTTGSNNILLGYDLDASSATVSNELNIGGIMKGNLSSNTLGLYGVAAVARATTAITAAAFTANTSGITDDSATWDGYTVGKIVTALRNIGILT